MIQENENQDVVDNSENQTAKQEAKSEAKAQAKLQPEDTAGDEANEAAGAGDSAADPQGNAKADAVKIEFPYSEIIREKVPKAFEVAEKVATDWKNEGDFTDLGIDHPVAGIVASQALTRAKKVEKKIEEKGVFTMAKMGLEIAKSQVETLKNKIKQ